MLRRSCVAAAVVLALASGAIAASPAAAVNHKVIVTVAKNLSPAAEKRMAVLILVSQNNGPPSAAVATAAKPLTVLLDNRGSYRVKAEIDTSCKGTCAASYRIYGSANHKLKVIPTCRVTGSGFVCSKIRIVRVY